MHNIIEVRRIADGSLIVSNSKAGTLEIGRKYFADFLEELSNRGNLSLIGAIIVAFRVAKLKVGPPMTFKVSVL
jgi:hypothetical protein